MMRRLTVNHLPSGSWMFGASCSNMTIEVYFGNRIFVFWWAL